MLSKSIQISTFCPPPIKCSTRNSSFKTTRVLPSGMPPKIKTWLSEADSANVKAYHIEGFEGRYKVVTAPIATATGLAVNFTKWLVFKGTNEVVTEFWSLLDDSQSVFHRSDARYFEILALDFSKEFLDKRNFDHPSYELIIHILGKGVSRTNLVSESNCPCLAVRTSGAPTQENAPFPCHHRWMESHLAD